MDELGALLLGVRECGFERLLEPRPREIDLGPVVARGVDLGHR